jgi:hypothetical protein
VPFSSSLFSLWVFIFIFLDIMAVHVRWTVSVGFELSVEMK